MTHEEIRAVYEQGPEAVRALVEALSLLITQQQEQIVQLQDRVIVLEARLATNSRNSSKPPSSDGFGKQTRSLRQPSQRKPGGQPGHPGATLPQVAEPDQRVQHAPTQCVACGTALREVIGRLGAERRQVCELPPLPLVVTEHRVVSKTCPGCGQENAGAFPDGLPSGARYGAGVQSLLTALNQEHLVPSERSCQIVADLCGQPVSEGTVQAAINGCAAALLETETHIKQGLSHADVAHFDETGMSVADKRGWRHAASTPQLTHDAYHEKRGSQATRAIGVLPSFQGRAIHAGCSAYWQYDCAHGLCNAHHLRELIFVHEQLGRAWAGQMQQVLLESQRAGDTARAHNQPALSSEQIQDDEERYAAILQAGAEEEQRDAPEATEGGAVQRNKGKARPSWIAGRSTRQRRWRFCLTLPSPLTTIWPSGIYG
jgi:transposase